MSEKLKVGVIGTGVLGRFHTKLYSENSKVELVGVYDAFPAAAEKVAAEFGTKAFAAIDDLVDQCDALTVAVPATLHHESVMPLIAKGKHILVEKPINSDVAGAKAMVDAAKAAGIVFGVGHVERFNPAMDYLMANKSFPRFIEARRMAKYPPQRPGLLPRGTEVSVILDLMVHDLDLVLALIDSEVESFDAAGAAVLSATEDIANVRIKFKNGATANVTASRISNDPERVLSLYQGESCAAMDFGTKSGILHKKGAEGIETEEIKLTDTNALADEIDDFVSAVIKTKETGTLVEPRVPGWQGLRTLELAVAICDQIAENNKKFGF